MTDKTNATGPQTDNTAKDPADWKTGDEPMTGAQRSYLHTLAAEASEEVDDTLPRPRQRNASRNASAIGRGRG